MRSSATSGFAAVATYLVLALLATRSAGAPRSIDAAWTRIDPAQVIANLAQPLAWTTGLSKSACMLLAIACVGIALIAVFKIVRAVTR